MPCVALRLGAIRSPPDEEESYLKAEHVRIAGSSATAYHSDPDICCTFSCICDSQGNCASSEQHRLPELVASDIQCHADKLPVAMAVCITIIVLHRLYVYISAAL